MSISQTKKDRKLRKRIYCAARWGLFSPEVCKEVKEQMIYNGPKVTPEQAASTEWEDRAAALQASVNTADKINKQGLQRPFSGQFESDRRRH